MSGPGPYGPGRRNEPRDRREPQFGPDISWPNGFRQLDTDSRRILESGYGRGAHDQADPGYGRGAYDHVDPGYGTGGRGSGYRAPAADDYGDPGYSDPSYDGPRGGSGGGSAGRRWPDGSRGSRAPGGSGSVPGPGGSDGYGSVPGYHVPDYRGPARPDLGGFQQSYSAPGVYPVTGAQEALPSTGPQPAADSWSGRDAGSAQSGRSAYPEQWYDHPRLDDSRRSGARPSDPRLQGMRYDELRYDESGDNRPGYDEPLDDDAWVAELRRGGPSFPQPPSGPPAGDRGRGDQRGSGWGQQTTPSPSGSGPSGPGQPGSGQSGSGQSGSGQGGWGQSGWGQSGSGQSGSGHSGWGQSGSGQSGWGQSGSGQSGWGQPSGYGQGRDDRGGPAPRGPRLSAGQPTSTLPASALPSNTLPANTLPSSPRPSAAPQDRMFSGDAYYGAPTAQVGVLTPPAIRRLEDPLDTGPQPVAPAAQVLAPQVRPGHGLDGPEITSSWPAQPQIEETESFEEFWAEDDDDADYQGLFPGEDTGFESRRKASTRTKADGRRIGRRRGRSNDHRLWLALLGVLVVAGAAIFGIVKFEFPSHGGPTHHMAAPPRIGSYVRTVDMEKQTKLGQLRNEIIKMSSGQASNVVSAVYESGNSAAGNTVQIVMFIGGHLANADPASSIGSFLQQFRGATVVSAGTLGGKAACVEAPASPTAVAICVFFDNDSFGEMVSPTMKANVLAGEMGTMRPSLETLAKK